MGFGLLTCDAERRGSARAGWSCRRSKGRAAHAALAPASPPGEAHGS
ncbi:hypothetical protein QJS66_02080 [Kocuria rhizophila]|nr:hypothetical protein QJS66_02080 [Kocuria rhizophila]